MTHTQRPERHPARKPVTIIVPRGGAPLDLDLPSESLARVREVERQQFSERGQETVPAYFPRTGALYPLRLRDVGRVEPRRTQ